MVQFHPLMNGGGGIYSRGEKWEDKLLSEFTSIGGLRTSFLY